MKHLKESNLSYLSHMKLALRYILRCQIVSFKLLIHAILPFIWQDTGWKKLGK